MKRTALGLLLATFAGATAAGDLSEPRYYDSNDFSAQLFYRVNFGADRAKAQTVGLRFDSVKLHAAGAPPLLQARFGAQGLDQLAVNGVDWRGALISSGQETGGGFLGGLTVAQIMSLGIASLVLIGAVADEGDEEEDPVGGTGSGSGG